MGATVQPGGVNFAVFSTHAQAVDLCLFDDLGVHELQRLQLTRRSGDIWHGFLPGATAGAVYGFRAHGPWAPAEGHRFSPNKLLLDPWAREIVGTFEWRREHFADDPNDNAAHALKARVVDDNFDWQGDQPLHRQVDDCVLYELHVRGFTMLHPGVPNDIRGSYAGLASDAAIAHLQRLGITAVSLLPVHQHLDEQRLAALGLNNYWGYNTVGFFCPEPRYASARHAAGSSARAVRDEFKRMVQKLHAAGIEVILDVVFNHSAESDAQGPTLSWRGLDNRSWYRASPHDRGTLENITGCGNTLDIRQPAMLQMVMDSLRHWVTDYHVDGFRFDLGPVLGRGDHDFDSRAAFFQAVAQDPVLKRTKLIAEPWDLGHGGYRLGDFPPGWLEWNDRFRDTVRAFWLGHASHRGALANVLTASAERLRKPGRSPAASVNFCAAHDGFTLRDLLSYSRRHNQANGEHNHDGHGHNLASNCGHEGPSADPAINQRRSDLQRALLSCTLLAQGTPMFAAGDELGHSQGGNNNAYCQDNRTSWIDWAHADEALIDFTSRVLRLRRELRPLRATWYDDQHGVDGSADIEWRQPDGSLLLESDWHDPHQRALTVSIRSPGASAHTLMLLINAAPNAVAFVLPAGGWRQQLPQEAKVSNHIEVGARQFVLLQAEAP